MWDIFLRLLPFICIGVLLVLVLIGLKIYSDKKYQEQLNLQWKQYSASQESRARSIMAEGGPKNFDDYMHLFPLACSNCGGRRFRKEERQHEYNLPSGIGVDGQKDYLIGIAHQVMHSEFNVCVRCGTEESGLMEKVGLVASPYLSKEDSDKIPEWSA
jgi:hypothetical protein